MLDVTIYQPKLNYVQANPAGGLHDAPWCAMSFQDVDSKISIQYILTANDAQKIVNTLTTIFKPTGGNTE